MANHDDNNIPTLEDVIQAGDFDKAVTGDLKTGHEDSDVETAAAAAESTAPTAETETEHADSNATTAAEQAQAVAEDTTEPDTEQRRGNDRRVADRRVSNEPLAEGMTERRSEQRRNQQRRASDRLRSQQLDALTEKIMDDMLPDLEQHIRLQLRFELEKHLPRDIFDSSDAETDK